MELLAAAERGDLATVQALADLSSVTCRDANGHTALALAAKQGHTSVVQHLITSGAEVDASTEVGSYTGRPNAVVLCVLA